MKILVSWSSGKDSAWMLHVIRREALGQPGALLTTVNASANRVAMHPVRMDVLRAQADATGLFSLTYSSRIERGLKSPLRDCPGTSAAKRPATA